VTRTEKMTDVPTTGIEHIVWAALHGSVSPSGLAARAQVDRALTKLRRELQRARLLRRLLPVVWFVPARTRKGRRFLAAAERTYPWLDAASGTGAVVDESLGWRIALYGDAALLALLPTFARSAGLLDRSASADMTTSDAAGTPGLPYY
jgi:hypothetical protein